MSAFHDFHGRFETLTGQRGRLWHTGWTESGWMKVLESLEQGAFPDNVRGSFAFVYEGLDALSRPIMTAAVDHIATVPLFFSASEVSSHFSSFAAQHLGSGPHDPSLFDRDFFWESQLFWGYTASERTTLKSLSRLPPGHRVELRAGSNSKPRAVRYHDIRSDLSDRPLDPRELASHLEAVILRTVERRTQNALLASGGTDSATLMAAVAKLGLKERVRVVTVGSENETQNESALVRRLSDKLELGVDFFEPPLLRIVRERKIAAIPSPMFLWKDYSFEYRKMAARHVGGESLGAILTGECGDQLFGGPKLSKQIPMLMQRPRWSARDVARQYLHLSMREVSPEWQGYETSPLVDWYKGLDPAFAPVYEEAIERIAEFFDGIKTRDLVNRLLAINLYFKGPYRLFHYSQDALRFAHPFSDWSLVKLALASRSKDKIYNRGRLKEIFYQAYRDHLIDEIWEAPKIGTAIPFA